MKIFDKNKTQHGPREHNSFDRDMHCYMQRPGFEPRTSHLFTIKMVNSSQYTA